MIFEAAGSTRQVSSYRGLQGSSKWLLSGGEAAEEPREASPEALGNKNCSFHTLLTA